MTTLLGLDLHGRTVLVAGGGPVAARRVRTLLDDGAHVRLVAPEVCEDLAELTHALEWQARDVVEADVDGVWLVLAATGSAAANRDLAAWATERRVWCVNASAVDEGTARTPATTRSGNVLVGVVTDPRAGNAQLPADVRADPRRAAAVRDRLAETLRDGVDQRRRRPGPGRVVLVGGGPGDVELLTLRGRRELAEADVVVADRLGPRGVLAELAPGVEIIDVGKTAGHHPIPQHEINAILVERAQRGQRVVRLKGGDPFVYGRGGEEVLACREAGVAVDVVPGVSSALSVPALAGIPLTHRGTVAAIHVVTGHEGLDDVALACVRDRAATLVVLMGVSMLPGIAVDALAAGADPATPVAIVENGSTPRQRVTRARLDDVAAVAAAAGVRAPAVIVIGDVAAEGVLEPDG